jgi:RNA polymerase sigma-70 factor (ECF subfamily)
MLSWRRNQGSSGPYQPEHPPFEQQLEQARRGESESLSALYRQFLPGVFGYIAARVPDRNTAEDLTSEVFLKMIEGISHLRAQDEAGFAAWLLQIARISVAGYYRKREHQPAIISLTSTAFPETDGEEAFPIPTQHPESDPVRRAEVRDEWGEVVKAINLLTEEQRQVIISRLILGYDVTTVARMIGKKANAVKALQFRGLKTLQRLLHREPPSQQQASSQFQGRREAP